MPEISLAVVSGARSSVASPNDSAEEVRLCRRPRGSPEMTRAQREPGRLLSIKPETTPRACVPRSKMHPRKRSSLVRMPWARPPRSNSCGRHFGCWWAARPASRHHATTRECTPQRRGFNCSDIPERSRPALRGLAVLFRLPGRSCRTWPIEGP
jgi:hypothetical protein